MTSVTLKTYPSMPIAAAGIVFGAAPNSEAFWNATTFIVSQSPRLQASGVMGYCYLSPGVKINGTDIAFYAGALIMPNGTVSEFESATAFLREYISSIPGYDIFRESIRCTLTCLFFSLAFNCLSMPRNIPTCMQRIVSSTTRFRLGPITLWGTDCLMRKHCPT